MPNRTWTEPDGSEWMEVDIPLASHNNTLCGIRELGCLTLNVNRGSHEDRGMILSYGKDWRETYDHNRCLDGGTDVTIVFASSHKFDKFGFITNPEKYKRMPRVSEEEADMEREVTEYNRRRQTRWQEAQRQAQERLRVRDESRRVSSDAESSYLQPMSTDPRAMFMSSEVRVSSDAPGTLSPVSSSIRDDMAELQRAYNEFRQQQLAHREDIARRLRDNIDRTFGSPFTIPDDQPTPLTDPPTDTDLIF